MQKRNKIVWMMTLAACLVWGGCQDVDERMDEEANFVPVRFSVAAVQVRQVTTEPQTRHQTRAPQPFGIGEQIAISAVWFDEAGTDTLAQQGTVWKRNACYENTALGLVCVDGNPIKQLQKSPLELAYFAVYPYSEQRAARFDFAAATNQGTEDAYKRSDLMMQRLDTTKVQTLSLQLQRKMVNIVITFKGEDLNDHTLGVTLKGVKYCVRADQNSQAVETLDATADIICQEFGTPTDTLRQFRAIVAPQRIAEQQQLIEIKADSRTILSSFSESFVLLSGQQLTQTFKVLGFLEEDGIYIRDGGDETASQRVDAPSFRR